MRLDEINRVDAAGFVAVLGGIFEHSPWVAEAVVGQRPFDSLDALHRAMCDSVAQADEALQLGLIRAHPQLASRAAVRRELTEASNREQSGAGLTECTPEEFARLSELNDAYMRRFGFPFILAVRGHDRSSVIAEMARRVDREYEVEFAEALRQIERIAGLRLADLLRAEIAAIPDPART